eukprot:3941973-Rhodomonas_salina.3
MRDLRACSSQRDVLCTKSAAAAAKCAESRSERKVAMRPKVALPAACGSTGFGDAWSAAHCCLSPDCGSPVCLVKVPVSGACRHAVVDLIMLFDWSKAALHCHEDANPSDSRPRELNALAP